MGLTAQQCFKACCIIAVPLVFFSISSTCWGTERERIERGRYQECVTNNFFLFLQLCSLLLWKEGGSLLVLLAFGRISNLDLCIAWVAYTPLVLPEERPLQAKSPNRAAKRKSTIKRYKSFPVLHLRIVLVERTVLPTPNLLEESLRCKARRTPEKPEQMLADFGRRRFPLSDMLIFR